MGDFNVFDEWGSYVGKFTPAGSGINGCLGMLALILAGAVAFAIYALVRLVFEGFKALFRGDLGTSFALI